MPDSLRTLRSPLYYVVAVSVFKVALLVTWDVVVKTMRHQCQFPKHQPQLALNHWQVLLLLHQVPHQLC